MLFRSTTCAAMILSAVALLSHLTPTVEAHSWADCVNWKPNNPSDPAFGPKDGHCDGFARRFPKNSKFGELDHADPSRHYQQEGDPSRALPCSDGSTGKDVGSDETRDSPPEKAYGGDWGKMTTTRVGDTLCVRWPAKNHAEKNEDNTKVEINFSKVRDGKDPSQQELLKNTIAKLSFRDLCTDGPDPEHRACGGCFKVPQRAAGTYLMQWRWMLNKGEYYTSCSDIKIGA